MSFSLLSVEKLLCLSFLLPNIEFFGFLEVVADKEMIHTCLHLQVGRRYLVPMMSQISNSFVL